MGLFDEMKDLAGAAEKAAKEHPDAVKSALGKLGETLDQQTGGKHHDQIVQAEQKAEHYLDEQSQQPSPSPSSEHQDDKGTRP